MRHATDDAWFWMGNGNGYVTGIAMATADWAGYYPIAHNGGNLDKTKVLNWFRGVAKLDCDKEFSQCIVRFRLAQKPRHNGQR